MAEVVHGKKSCVVNPLKMSAPLGGTMAFLGLDSCMPMMHGSQGCTAFGLVLLVRHFKEAIPLQTTAMSEITTILGGIDNIEQAILNIASRAQPKIIGICSTGLVETRGEDGLGDLRLIRQRHPELADLGLVYASTPDFIGGFEDGWSRAVAAIIDTLVEAPTSDDDAGADKRINILAGSHLMPADLIEIREIVEAFGLEPVILPDLSGSLDGHVPEIYVGTTFGGTTLADIRRMSCAKATLAIGEQVRIPAMMLQEKWNVPAHVFERLTGLSAVDAFIKTLAEISGQPVPTKYRRQRHAGLPLPHRRQKDRLGGRA